MPAYTIQQDPPWMAAHTSAVPSTVSISPDDYSAAMAENIQPLKTQASYHKSYHAHPQQEIQDAGPQIRQSRLPIFKHVRSMLHKPPPITTPGNPKWDEYTGELSESGKPPKVKPSAYVSPFEGAFKTSRKRSPARPNKIRKNQSPVSVLRDEEMTPVERVKTDPIDATTRSPVSPVSPAGSEWENFADDEEVDRTLLPEPLSPNVQRALPQSPRSSQQIKRKPVSRCTSSAENHPPTSPQHSPSQSSDLSADVNEDTAREAAVKPNSHFSWTTYAPSEAPGRPSIDTMATKRADDYVDPPRSRFSWSTVHTGVTHAHPGSPPSSPPSLPTKYSELPVQSILSRRRPVERIEKEEWAPPGPRARPGDTPRSGTPKDSSTPTSAITARYAPLPKLGTPTTSNSPSTAKALPPPPQLSDSHNLTHLQTLLAHERDISHQRRNVERGIRELEKIEKASPLDVPFSTVRDAKKRLREYRTRLDEVRLEERDIGIAIVRARLKEEKETGGDGETLWVRRVTS